MRPEFLWHWWNCGYPVITPWAQAQLLGSEQLSPHSLMGLNYSLLSVGYHLPLGPQLASLELPRV